jgi:hypothetical protein
VQRLLNVKNKTKKVSLVMPETKPATQFEQPVFWDFLFDNNRGNMSQIISGSCKCGQTVFVTNPISWLDY